MFEKTFERNSTKTDETRTNVTIGNFRDDRKVLKALYRFFR